MAVLRRARILVAIILGFVIFFTTRHYDSLPTAPSWSPSSISVFPVSPTKESEVLGEVGYDPVQPQLVEDAHRLNIADAFLPHFQAVTRLPGMTVAEAKATCVWPEGVKVNFQYGPESDWFAKDVEFSELEARRAQWHSFIDRGMVPYASAKGRFSGRGVVIVAGNQDTMMRVRVILRQLLKLGSTIPVEINYWDDEMDPKTMTELKGLYPTVFFNDLSNATNVIQIKKSGIYVNYQLKTAAVVNSRFAEPLLLDSDNIPVVDPASLFETDEYKTYGTIFWPDIARTRPQNPMWALTNTPCAKNEYEQESGQLLVDKTRFFYHLQLAAWFNNNQSDYYNKFILGDKDTFRFAWHALKTQYGKPRKWVTSVGTANWVPAENKSYYCGHTFAQHHPNGSVAFMHGGLLKTVDPEIMTWNRDVKGGFFRDYKRAKGDEDAYLTTDVTIKFDGAAYKPVKLPDFHGASCTDMYDVEPRSLEEIVPGFEQRFREIGGYWMLDEWEKKNAELNKTATVKASMTEALNSTSVTKEVDAKEKEGVKKEDDLKREGVASGYSEDDAHSVRNNKDKNAVLEAASDENPLDGTESFFMEMKPAEAVYEY